MDAVSDPLVREVVVKSSAQVGKTLILKGILGYHIHQDPAPILLLQPTIEMAEAFSKDRLAPMIRDTPVLRGRVADVKSRASGNTILHKKFPGGHITMAGANAPASLASRPIRVVLCDEIDRYPASAGTEGDPVNLAKKRTATFWNRKVVLVSTPTLKGVSRIDVAFEASDQRHYLVPCPHCGHYHRLEWGSLVMEEGKPETAMLACPECGAVYDDSAKPRMLKLGRWEASAEFKGVAGFHLNELYSPWRTWAEVADDYLKAEGKPELMKTFVNTSLGEVYAEAGDAPEWQRLFDKREDYKSNTIPADVVFLTAGVDVQKDRLEMEIVGWAPGKQSYSIDYRVIVGDTETSEPWDKLRDIINTEQWEHPSGAMMGLRQTCVDSGYRTNIVYDFCRRFPLSRVAAIKGREDQAMPISPPRAIDRRRDGKAVKGLKLITVGSSMLKAEFYAWLKLDISEGIAPAGYCHFPQYDERHFKELTSEQVIIKLVRGYPKEVWTKTPGVRNEPLDCRVYARAAAAIVGMDRWKDADWQRMASQFGAPKPEPKTKPETPAPQAKQQQPQQQPRPHAPRRRSSFWDK